MGTNSKLPQSKGYGKAGADPRGRFLDKTPPRKMWELCTVGDYSPQSQTYTVFGGSAGPMPEVRRFVQDPGEVGILARGTEVVVHHELGFPVIAAVLKSVSTNAVEVNPARISEVRGVGGEDGVYAQQNAASSVRPPNDPIDLLQDDWARKSKQNNMIGVLSGGTNIMSSSPMAQIRTHSTGTKDLVEVCADVYRHISSMGNMEIINNGGKTSLIWRAGADQSTENGAHAENWTLRLDAGAEGDLFRFKVTTPHNNTLCEIHMSADGRISLTGVAGIDISSGTRGTAREDVAENKEVLVLKDMTTEVVGEVSETYGAGLTTSVNTSASLFTGNDLKEAVGHDRSTHISNKLVTTVEGGGKLPPPDSGNIAILWDAVNGGVETVTGNSGAAVKQAINFVNYQGDVNFSVTDKGKFHVISTGDDSVILGADGSATDQKGFKGHKFTVTVPKHHVCMWEEFEKFAKTLIEWCDDHTHLTAMGPSSPAKAGAPGPLSAKLNSKIEPVKSTRVLVGA